jgi:hypothetical protein
MLHKDAQFTRTLMHNKNIMTHLKSVHTCLLSNTVMQHCVCLSSAVDKMYVFSKSATTANAQ